MNSLNHLDLVLGECLEWLAEDAIVEIRNAEAIDSPNKKELSMKIGRIISELWNVRDQIYKINPALKRDFVVELEQDKQRWEDLNKLYLEAQEMEASGKITSAKSLYKELYTISHFGYFCLLAEAGLYRIRLGHKKE